MEILNDFYFRRYWDIILRTITIPETKSKYIFKYNFVATQRFEIISFLIAKGTNYVCTLYIKIQTL